MINYLELINYVDKIDLHGKITLFFNEKKVNPKKLIKILKNNVSKKSNFNVNKKLVEQPFYKGDYHYFINNYNTGLCRLKKLKIYIIELNG